MPLKTFEKWVKERVEQPYSLAPCSMDKKCSPLRRLKQVALPEEVIKTLTIVDC